MEYHKVKHLIKLFWDGKCSEEQEKELTEYFAFGEVPKEFSETADYFLYLNAQQDHGGLDLDFDMKVMDKITQKRKGSSRSMWIGMAASIAIIAGLFFGTPLFENAPDNPVIALEDSFEDPEQAYLEVKKALFMLSGKMNKGKEYGSELKKFSFAKEEIKVENEK